jgi:hypothetical protein
MTVPAEPSHVTELLAPYYLDTLGPAEGAAVEDHLGACPTCRSEAETAVDTVAALALLSDRDRDELLDAFGALNRTGPPPARFVEFFAPEPEPDPTPSRLRRLGESTRSAVSRTAPEREEAPAAPSVPRVHEPPVADALPPDAGKAAPPPSPSGATSTVLPPFAGSEDSRPQHPDVPARPGGPMPRAVASPAALSGATGKAASSKGHPEPGSVSDPTARTETAVPAAPSAALRALPAPPEVRPAKNPTTASERVPESRGAAEPAEKPAETRAPAGSPEVAVGPRETAAPVGGAAATSPAPASAAVPAAPAISRTVAEPHVPAPAKTVNSARARRRRALARTGGLLAVVLMTAGVTLGALVRGGDPPPVPPAVTAAAVTAGKSRVTLSVTAVTQGDGVDIRATVGGLRKGTGYRLEAATSDGHSWHVLSWAGDGKIQDVSGHLRVPLTSLVSFTVARGGGGSVVSAYVGGSPAPTRRG